MNMANRKVINDTKLEHNKVEHNLRKYISQIVSIVIKSYSMKCMESPMGESIEKMPGFSPKQRQWGVGIQK